MTDYTNDPRVEVLQRLVGFFYAEDLLAALDAVDPARQWRPIEEAPRDGTDLLVWDGTCVVPAFWDDGLWWQPVGYNDYDPVEPAPTHYLPVPAPPEEG